VLAESALYIPLGLAWQNEIRINDYSESRPRLPFEPSDRARKGVPQCVKRAACGPVAATNAPLRTVATTTAAAPRAPRLCALSHKAPIHGHGRPASAPGSPPARKGGGGGLLACEAATLWAHTESDRIRSRGAIQGRLQQATDPGAVREVCTPLSSSNPSGSGALLRRISGARISSQQATRARCAGLSEA
jgi:hypothetical protein